MNKCFNTPRLLVADAYTIGSGSRFESKEAEEKSVYYLTFRRGPADLAGKAGYEHFNKDDNRIVFAGLQRILDRLFSEPITHEEIDETLQFLQNRKATTQGLRPFEFPEQMWRRVVDEFNGYPPLNITAMPEGSVVYPNEPVIRVESLEDGFGPLAAWFESKLLHVWAATRRLTDCRHWLNYNIDLIRSIEKDKSDDEIRFLASLMMHDFGDRAGICAQESEDLGLVHLYCFLGTDTFAGAYQAWKNGAPDGVGTSVDALAHRIVQGFVEEGQCYNTIYDAAQPGDIVSMVADCYDYYNAVENYLLPLAKRSVAEGTNIICVSRPDSGDPIEQILWTLNLAVANGLYEERNGWKYMTTLRVIEGDSMNWKSMMEINQALINAGFAPHGCLIYGVGGWLRNSITRDDFSTKYALCAVGYDYRPVVKNSHAEGKKTLPLAAVKRDKEALETGITLDIWDAKQDWLVPYYFWNKEYVKYMKPHPLDSHGMQDNFTIIQDRVLNEFNSMPFQGGGMTYDLRKQRDSIIKGYLDANKSVESK